MKDQSKTKPTLIKKKTSLDEANEYNENIINTVREPLIILDQDLRVVSVSRSFMSTASLHSSQMRSGSSGKERI
jgi:hypothetical protein